MLAPPNDQNVQVLREQPQAVTSPKKDGPPPGVPQNGREDTIERVKRSAEREDIVPPSATGVRDTSQGERPYWGHRILILLMTNTSTASFASREAHASTRFLKVAEDEQHFYQGADAIDIIVFKW